MNIVNEVTVYELKNDLEFRLIHPSLAHAFQIETIKVYESEYSDPSTFKLPTSLLDGDGDFYEVVSDLYRFAIDSLMREDFPEDRWDNFKAEEYEDYEEMLGNHPLTLEEVFLHDMKLVFNAYGLFYLEVETRFSPNQQQCWEEVVAVHNSPLKEIW